MSEKKDWHHIPQSCLRCKREIIIRVWEDCFKSACDDCVREMMIEPVAKVVTIEEARARLKKKSVYETVRRVEPYKNTSVRIRFYIPGFGKCQWQLSREKALELSRALTKAVFAREPSEIVQKYIGKRKA